MKKCVHFLLSCFLLMALLLPMTATAAEKWDEEFSRIMDITNSLSKAEIKRLNDLSMEFMENYPYDLAIAAIPEERMAGYDSPAQFATELYESCNFGYGAGKDGFMCLYLVDTEQLYIVPIGGAVGALPEKYLRFMEERVPTMREKNGVFGVFYGCQGLLKNGLDTQGEKATETVTEPQTEQTTTAAKGDFERCGEGSDKPVWFPADLEKAHPYYDPVAPRVVDYAGILSEDTEAALQTRIAEISAETGKDIVVVTDSSNYGLGDHIYAADFYDYNGYGLGEEHEGVLLFLDMNPQDRGGWTVETGSETRALLPRKTADRLDDFLYATLGTGDYEKAVTEWVEDVYGLFTVGVVRPPFWYKKDGELPKEYVNPQAPVVVDEWGLLDEAQMATLQERAEFLKETYGVTVCFHTTGDQLGLTKEAYNQRYWTSMGYGKDGILFTVENTDGETSEVGHVYAYGEGKNRLPKKFLSRVENNASTARDGYGRLFKGQKLLTTYLEKGRVPRNGVYWSLIVLLSLAVGGIGATVPLDKASEGMRTVKKQRLATAYLDRKHTSVRILSERLLYQTTSRVYVSSPSTTTSSSHSSGGSTYKSSYSGHSGTSHSGHGRKF